MLRKKIVFIFLPFFINSQEIKSAGNDLNDLTYLEKNKQEFRKDNSSGFKIFDKNFYNNSMFLIGENHGFVKSHEFELEFIKHLKAKTNFKYYLDESSYTDVIKINRYLDTGNEEILKDLINSYKGTFAWNKQNFEKWKYIYTLNKILVPKDQIRFLGVDIEQDPKNSLQYIRQIIKPVVKKLSKDDPLLALYNFQDKYFKLAPIVQNILTKKDSFKYKTLFKSQYFNLFYVIENLNNLIICDNSDDWNKCRDEKIFNNFVTLYKKNNLKGKKFYGMWGKNHIYQEKSEGVDWFASRLKNSDLGFKNKIASIGMFYIDGSLMLPIRYTSEETQKAKKDFYYIDSVINNSDEFNKILGISNLKKVTKRDSTTIFNLNNNDSPYQKQLELINNPDYKSSVTTDFIQYAVLIRDSKSTNPFGNNKKSQ